MFGTMAAQYGVISRQQALDCGLTKRRIQALLDRGEWERVAPSVYRHAAHPPSWRGQVMAAVLWSGGVASHRTAAVLWGLIEPARPVVEVTVPVDRRRQGPFLVHRTTQWDRIDRCDRFGIACTGVDRTILDLAATSSLRKVELAAEAAMRTGATDWPKLRACLIRHARQGRDGSARLRRLLELRHGDDPLPRSEWSRLVDHILTDAGLPPAVLEFRVLGPHGQPVADLDLAWPEHRVAIELDSVRWHLNRASFERDRRKRNQVRLLGWVVHEVTWSMSVEDRRGLVRLVRQALAA